MNPHFLIAACLLAVPATRLLAEEPSAAPGRLIFSDAFDRADLGPWKVVIPGFEVADGVLKGRQDRDDHGAVCRVYAPMRDVQVDLRFKLSGSPNFNVVFDDKNFKGSHAGHICRVAINPHQIRLGDDKEGIMRNDIFAMRKDPAQRAAADQLTKGRAKIVKREVTPQQWHALSIRIVDDEMTVHIDGEVVGTLKSPGIAHPTKESVHFTVNGKETHFDDINIWTLGAE